MKSDHSSNLPAQDWDKTLNFLIFVDHSVAPNATLGLFPTHTKKKWWWHAWAAPTGFSPSCSISSRVQDSIYIISSTSITFFFLFFHLQTLRLRHTSPRALLTSPVGCVPTTSNLVSTILHCFFSPGKSCPLQGLSITADKTTFTPGATAKSLRLPRDNQLSGQHPGRNHTAVLQVRSE